jgi:hypothetical protein
MGLHHGGEQWPAGRGLTLRRALGSDEYQEEQTSRIAAERFDSRSPCRTWLAHSGTPAALADTTSCFRVAIPVNPRSLSLYRLPARSLQSSVRRSGPFVSMVRPWCRFCACGVIISPEMGTSRYTQLEC